MFKPDQWVRAVNPNTKKLEVVMILSTRKGEYTVWNGLDQWTTWMVKSCPDRKGPEGPLRIYYT